MRLCKHLGHRENLYCTGVIVTLNGSDGIEPTGSPPVGNTVDVQNATWTNTIGTAELITVWEDPDFDADQRAVYYARVIEIPTPHWTAYDALRFNVDLPADAPRMTQERAYTSPIWYTPEDRTTCSRPSFL